MGEFPVLEAWRALAFSCRQAVGGWYALIRLNAAAENGIRAFIGRIPDSGREGMSGEQGIAVLAPRQSGQAKLRGWAIVKRVCT